MSGFAQGGSNHIPFPGGLRDQRRELTIGCLRAESEWLFASVAFPNISADRNVPTTLFCIHEVAV
jgi:hypothetical protein